MPNVIFSKNYCYRNDAYILVKLYSYKSITDYRWPEVDLNPQQ